MNPNESSAPGRKKLLLIISAVLLLALIVAAAVWLLRQPSREDFAAINDTTLKQVSDTQEKLAPAVNTYLATFKKHQNETGSVDQAEAKSKDDLDAFKRTETDARSALKTLSDAKAANDGEVAETLEQVVDTFTARTDYLASLVGSYADLQTLFGGKDNDICSDIFIGETTDLTDRKQRLSDATPNCYEALKTLEASGNTAYSDYAKKLEKRVRLLETDATVIADTEKQFKEFTEKKTTFEQKLSELEQRQASDAEYDKLRNEIEAVNSDIAESQADFDYSSKRYTRTVKELPSLYDTVFSSEVPAKLDYFKSLADVRLKTLRLIIEDKLLETS